MTADRPGPRSRDLLSGPRRARERLRRMFHPERGWFRRLERRVSYLLSSRVYPRIPGLGLPYAWQLGRSLTLSEAEIEVSGLPESFEGIRLLLITDLHVGPFLSGTALRRTLTGLVALEPDMILVGGDLVTARAEEIDDCAPALRVLRAPLGVFAVLGNHDHYSASVDRLIAGIEACGVTVLHNRCVRVERAGASLCVAGVDDLLMGRPDLAAALERARTPVVLLSHNPDLFFDAARHGVALTLAGHTHAGQFRIPGLPVLVRQSRYRLDQGRFRIGQSELVVSRGLGAVGLPCRIACPPEAVLLTLRERTRSVSED